MNEENYNVDRGEMDIGSALIVPDDNCDHLKCILWDMRQRADLRKKFTPRPKPTYQHDCGAVSKSGPKPLNIGVKARYSLLIVRGIFQLHMIGQSDLKISQQLGIPEEVIHKIIHARNSTTEREWRRVHAEVHTPKPLEVIKSIAQEARYAYGNDSAPL